jgi:hypothetical protein
MRKTTTNEETIIYTTRKSWKLSRIDKNKYCWSDDDASSENDVKFQHNDREIPYQH